jgi:ADP-heptose:LPS heptosyltransferase
MRVLLVRGGALGDMLLLRRAIASLRAAEMTVGLLAPSAGEVLLGEGPAEVQEWIPWEHPDLARLFAAEPVASGGVAEGLRSYDAALAYTANQALAGGLRALIPRVLTLDPTGLGPDLHASRAFEAPALTLGGVPSVEPPLLRPRAQDDRAILPLLHRLPRRFLAIHPGSGSARKNWPPARFAQLIRLLVGDSPFLLAQGPADEAVTQALAGLRPAAVLASHLSPRGLGALLSRSGLYVGNDSGVSHLAAASGAPTLALFGPTSATLWSPLGPRVVGLPAPEGNLERLEAETVAQAAQDALRSWALPGPPSG